MEIRQSVSSSSSTTNWLNEQDIELTDIRNWRYGKNIKENQSKL